MHMAGESLGCHVSINDIRETRFSGLDGDGTLCGHGQIMRVAIPLSKGTGCDVGECQESPHLWIMRLRVDQHQVGKWLPPSRLTVSSPET